MHNFKELIVWQKGRSLVKEIYLLTKNFPEQEKFGIISQIQRACISIPTNISEGSGRKSNKDFSRFLEIARSSSFELENLIILSNDLEFISEKNYKEIIQKIEEIQKMLFSLQNKINK